MHTTFSSSGDSDVARAPSRRLKPDMNAVALDPVSLYRSTTLT